MTRRLVFGTILAAALATPASWPFHKSKGTKSASSSASASTASSKDKSKDKDKSEPKQGFDGTYTGGTVAAIPQFTNGKLDLSDRSALHFHYGKPSWSLNYNKVTSIEVSDRKNVRILTVPKLIKDKRVLNIAFDGDKGQKQNLLIEMPVSAALTALPLLEERTGKAAVVEGAMNPDGWWGDRYWRTARSQALWDEANGQNKTAVASNKQ